MRCESRRGSTAATLSRARLVCVYVEHIEAIGVNERAYLSTGSIPNWVDSPRDVAGVHFHVSALIIVEIERYH